MEKAVLLKSEVENLCDNCKERVEKIMTEEGEQRIAELQAHSFNPLDGFSIIGNQINSIPGMASIRRIGSELPSNVHNLPSMMKKKGPAKTVAS